MWVGEHLERKSIDTITEYNRKIEINGVNDLFDDTFGSCTKERYASHLTQLDARSRHQFCSEAFFRYLASHQQTVYEEAATSLDDPRWTPEEGRIVQGHVRRAIAENVFRRAADDCGLTWKSVDYIGHWMSSVHVYAGNLRLTLHRVASPWSFLRPCESRKQDAAANAFLDGYFLDGTLLAPLPSIENANAIQMYILHGRHFVRGELTNFINVVVPDSELKSYCWQKTGMELEVAYKEKMRSRTVQETQAPVVLPTLKKRNNRNVS